MSSDSSLFSSNPLLDPKIWGPKVWETIDIFIAGYGEHPTEGLKLAAKDFFKSLQQLLPCPFCRNHYRKLLKEKPIDSYLENNNLLKEYVQWLKSEVKNNIQKQLELKKQLQFDKANTDEEIEIESDNDDYTQNLKSFVKNKKEKKVKLKISKKMPTKSIQRQRFRVAVPKKKSIVQKRGVDPKISKAQTQLEKSAKLWHRPCACY